MARHPVLALTELLREAAESQHARVTGAPRTATVTLTTSCNLRCAYCYQGRSTPRTVSWSVLRASLDLVLRSSHSKAEIRFTGGEPLLQPELLRRAVEYVASARRAGPPPRLAVATNGLVLEEATARFLASHGVRVQLSMDGVPPAQDQRGVGTFRQLDRLLGKLARDLPEFFRGSLSIHLTLTAGNLAHLADSVSYFLRRGVGRIVVSPRITHDDGWRPGMIDELDRQLDRICLSSIRHHARTGEVPFSPFRRPRDAASTRRDDDRMCGVTAGEGVFVSVDGALFGCPALGDTLPSHASGLLEDARGAARLGDVRQPGLGLRLREYRRAMRDLPMMGARRRKRSSYGRCATCRQLAGCRVCPVSIAHIPGNTDPDRVPDLQCAFNLVAGTQADRFVARLAAGTS